MLKYKIAGIVVEMDVKYDRLKERGEPYLYSGKEKAVATLTLSETVMERARKKYQGLSDGDLEYLLYGALFYDKLLDFNGMMLHASAVAIDGRAYLFSADSGVGKSTHTALWKSVFPEAVIVNDDKPAIRLLDGNLYVFGTPFSGKHDKSVNACFLLGGICFLERGEENFIEEISPKEALPLFLKQSSGMNAAQRVEKRLNVTDKVLSFSRLYKMRCNMDIAAAKMSFKKMNMALPVSLNQLLPVMEELLSNNMEVTFVTNGTSMMPLLKSKESVTVKRVQQYKKGDVVLFKRLDESFVLHRIIKIKGDTVYTEGDSLLTKDEPIKKEQIIGKAVAFIRSNGTLKETDFKYKLYKIIYVSALGKALRRFKRKINR